MALHLVPESATQAMDDTAAWAVANMPARQPANRADDATIQRCFNTLQQSLAHYLRASRPAGLADFDPTPDCTPVGDEDDEDLTPEQAIDLATEELLSTPNTVARWLLSHCSTPESKVPAAGIDELHDDQVMELPIPALLAVAMTGTNEQALIALRVLREVAKELNYPQIARRANAMLVPL
jgi:hypothetical protein